ncbi:MAG: molecular chaperone DnaJ [Clostridia bacterium]|nr:molecular chaperone DnaJ [Clostridia bacterium]
MAKKDYYEVLGVDKGASDDEIKSAFRKAAKSCHPDLHPNDSDAEARFKEVNEAYEVLSDKQKRAKYDQFGHAAFDPTGGGYGGQSGAYTTGAYSDFSDILNNIFGGAGFGGFNSQQKRTGPVQGDDIGYRLTLTFEEAVFGVTKEISISREENCRTCSGSGAKPGTSTTTCPTCGGKGQVQYQQRTMFGVMSNVRTCEACNGSGKIIKEPCTDCRGTGRVVNNRKISVNIPAGVDSGDTLTIRGEGADGLRGGPKGDLYIKLTVRPHKVFVRDGIDIKQTITVPVTTAVLGDTIELKTLSGIIQYEIPEGTQPGAVLRLKGHGVSRPKSSAKGDMLITVNVEIPKKLTKEQREAFESLHELMTGNKKPPSKRSVFGKKK